MDSKAGNTVIPQMVYASVQLYWTHAQAYKHLSVTPPKGNASVLHHLQLVKHQKHVITMKELVNVGRKTRVQIKQVGNTAMRQGLAPANVQYKSILVVSHLLSVLEEAARQ